MSGTYSLTLFLNESTQTSSHPLKKLQEEEELDSTQDVKLHHETRSEQEVEQQEEKENQEKKLLILFLTEKEEKRQLKELSIHFLPVCISLLASDLTKLSGERLETAQGLQQESIPERFPF